MRCTSCGAELSTRPAKFCINCGSLLSQPADTGIQPDFENKLAILTVKLETLSRQVETLSRGRRTEHTTKPRIESESAESVTHETLQPQASHPETIQIHRTESPLGSGTVGMQRAFSRVGGMRPILATSPKLLDIGVLGLRLLLAVPFLFAGLGKLGPTRDMVVGMFMSVGFDKVAATLATTLVGALEIISAVFIIVWVFTRPAALYQMMILLLSLGFFQFDLTQGPAIWKDPGLLGAAVLLILYGAGRYSVDARLSR